MTAAAGAVTYTVPLNAAVAAIIFGAFLAVMFGALIGMCATLAAARPRLARTHARLHRLSWALRHLADGFRDADGLWEGAEVAAHLEGVLAEAVEHPLDEVRLGWRARLNAARLRRRDKHGGAR